MDFSKLYGQIKDILDENQIKKNEQMKNHTSFRIGGPAKIMVLPSKTEEVLKIIGLCKQNKTPFFVMGNGTNLLVQDEGIKGVVIKLAQNYNDAVVSKNIIRCKAGMALSTAAQIALQNNLTGLEFVNGIPGTVGGAAVMNAGAYGGEMAKVVKRVTVMDIDGNLVKMENSELQYSYRQCVLQQGQRILLEVEIELEKGYPEEIQRKMEDYFKRRKEKQPLNLPSAGSTFKRPKGNFAGALIEKAGLKGYKIGGAMISDKHAGFIVNVNNATFKDVKNLIDYAQSEVEKKFGVHLESEIIIIGN